MPNSLIFILLLQWFNQNLAAPQDLLVENKIKNLESEKSELFKQINDAIDDSVVSLKKSNTTDSQVGISYIQDLKKQIKYLNEAEPTDKVNENEGIIVDDKSDLENRRMQGMFNTEKYAHRFVDPLERRTFLKDIAAAEERKAKVELAYFEAMKDKSKKWRQRYEARLNIQQRLDKWIEKRERERQRIKAMKQKKMIFKEKCPDYGAAKSRKESKKPKRGKKPKKSGGKSYPCCRKCCKKSYLGCLKKK